MIQNSFLCLFIKSYSNRISCYTYSTKSEGMSLSGISNIAVLTDVCSKNQHMGVMATLELSDKLCLAQVILILNIDLLSTYSFDCHAYRRIRQCIQLSLPLWCIYIQTKLVSFIIRYWIYYQYRYLVPAATTATSRISTTIP